MLYSGHFENKFTIIKIGFMLSIFLIEMWNHLFSDVLSQNIAECGRETVSRSCLPRNVLLLQWFLEYFPIPAITFESYKPRFI